jgi:predicted nucleic acid-binding protein
VNVVDSSGWLEYLADGPNAGFFAKAVEDAELLVVPVICVYEVFKAVLRQRGEDEALQAVAALLRGRIVSLDADLAMEAAWLGLENKLALADSIILATAWREGATLWTQDEHFAGMAGVRHVAKAE